MVPPILLDFLEDLKNNNNREWFQDHQEEYGKFKDAYKSLVNDMVAEMSKGDSSLNGLEFKDCSFRINRDIRFTKDKSPYKTNLGVWMCKGGKKTNMAGYYLHIEKGNCFIAGGVHWPDSNDLKKVRREIDGFYDDLEEILADKEFKKLYDELDRDENNSLKTSPKDYDKDHPAIEYLKLKSFTATHKFPDKELKKDNFVQEISKKLLVLKPLVNYINRALTTE